MNKILTFVCLFAAGLGTVSAETRYKGDINLDGKVDLADMVTFATAINEGKADKTVHDINASGKVDDADLHALANIILSEKLTEDTGLNVGIGGWEEGGEDFSGAVGAPSRSAQTPETYFYAEGPKKDVAQSRTYIDFGIRSASDDFCAILFNIQVPNDVEFEAGKYVELVSGLVPGHAIYGTPVVKKDSDLEKHLRFIVFSPTLSVLGKSDVRIYYSTSRYVRGYLYFCNCNAIANGSAAVQGLPEQYGEGAVGDWNIIKKVSSITFEQGNSVDVFIGESFGLNAYVEPWDANNRKLKWTSSNPEVATVDENGDVTTQSVGETTISAAATDGSGVTATCRVKVLPRLVESLIVEPTVLELGVGNSSRLTAHVSPEEATDKRIEWSSDNEVIATVDSDGVVTVHSEGATVIRVRTLDGSNLEVVCTISGLSGIIDVISDGMPIDVYTVGGVVVMKAVSASRLSDLPVGLYIIRQDKKCYKVLK